MLIIITYFIALVAILLFCHGLIALFGIRHKPYHHIAKIDNETVQVTVFLYFRGRGMSSGGYTDYVFTKHDGKWKYQVDKFLLRVCGIIYLACIVLGTVIMITDQGSIQELLLFLLIMAGILVDCILVFPLYAYRYIRKKMPDSSKS